MVEDYTGGEPPTNNPFGGTDKDTLSTLNLKFHAAVTRALVAALVALSRQD